jgi:phosphate transport system substrate-binding protein
MLYNFNYKLFSALTLVSALFFMSGQAIARDQISIVGSSTVYPFSTTVAEKFGQQAEFKTPVVESTGSGGGMKIFCKGIGMTSPDITNASRAIKSSEKELCAKNGIDPIEYLIGYDGIVIANNSIADRGVFTKEDIFNAVSFKVIKNGKWVVNPHKKWSDIRSELPDRKIDIMIPPPTSGTRDAFVELVMHSVCKKIYKMPKKGADGYKEKCTAVRTDAGYVVQMGENDNLLIEKLQNDENRFAVFGYSFLDQNSDRVQGSSIDGVIPSGETIADASYKVSRPLYFYLKKQHIDVIPGLEEYVELFMSERMIGAGGELEAQGLIPLN